MTTYENDWGIFFWKPPSVFSNWTLCNFRYKVDGYTYNYTSSEQAIMHSKAILFKDIKTANEILNTNNPHRQKYLGRQIKPFDESIWTDWINNNILSLLYSKFNQNENLKHILLKTEDKLLFEASPYDNLWGTGVSPEVSVKSKIEDIKYWKGKNILGKVLMDVREILKMQK